MRKAQKGFGCHWLAKEAVRARMGVKLSPHTRLTQENQTFIGWPKNVLALDISASHFVNCSGVKNLTTCSRIWSRAAASFLITSTRVTSGFSLRISSIRSSAFSYAVCSWAVTVQVAIHVAGA